MRKLSRALTAIAALSVAAPAEAQHTIIDYSFSGGATGTMSLDFDSGTSTYSLVTLDLTLGSGLTSSIDFTASNSGLIAAFPPNYAIGGTINGVATVVTSTEDFLLVFDPGSASQTVDAFYSIVLVSPPTLFQPRVTLTEVALTPVGGVPEPSTWAMLLLGFAGIGLAMRRRKIAEGIVFHS